MCVEPVAGSAVACCEAHSSMIGVLHLADYDLSHFLEFAWDNVKVQLVVYLQYHS